MDRLSPEHRSWLMSRVPSKNTSAELRVRRAAHARGLRFRLHRVDLPGRPDMVFPKYRVVVFVHGCFWHRHAGCAKSSVPDSNSEFWAAKFARNVERDLRAMADLRALGWRPEVIWECETKSPELLSQRLEHIFYSSVPLRS